MTSLRLGYKIILFLSEFCTKSRQLFVFDPTHATCPPIPPSLNLFTLSASCQQNKSYQYSETNVMHILFSVLRIKGLYMFRALLAHPQEAVHKRHQDFTPILVQPTDITRTQYTRTKCRLWSASWGWASNDRNMYRALILNKLNKNWIMLVSLYWYSYYDARSTKH
jgi:hypothetical protein